MKLKNNLLSAITAAIFLIPLVGNASQRFTNFKEELGLSSTAQHPHAECTHLYIVHHGDTLWTEEGRLQGWADIPLSDAGREQMQMLARELSPLKVDAIYSSSLSRAVESAKIVQEGHDTIVITELALRGESHGSLEGLKKNEYQKDPHYIDYESHTSEERIFLSVGPGGLSKADVARLAIPKLQEICRKHPGQNVVVVTHGGVLKFLSFLLGNYTPEEINEVPHGQMLRIDGDGSTLFLAE